MLDWISNALKQSNEDKHRHHQESIERLQAEYKVLENRINAMYVDKLDGKVSSELCETMSGEWRHQQNRIRDNIGEHQKASEVYIHEGIRLIELAQNAHKLL